MQSDHRGEWLSPLAEGVWEVFTEKVTFAEKLDYSEFLEGNDLVVCVHRGLVHCQEQNGSLINICRMNDMTSQILSLLVNQLL